MENFTYDVPIEVQEKLLQLTEIVKNDYIGEYNDNCCMDGEIEKISGNSYDGFMAFQRGGFEVCSFYSNAYLTREIFTKNHHEHIAGFDVFNDFLEEYNLEKTTEFDNLNEDLRDKFYDYEIEYFEEDILRFECWVEDDTDEVFLRLSVNYKDAPYYRSKYDETIKEITLPFSEFISKDLVKLANLLFN